MEAAAALATVKALQIPLMTLSILGLTEPLWPPKRIIKNNTCFDYIVVGGGTAGCAVANRLSENPNTKVLVIEKGDDPTVDTFFPPLFVTDPMSPKDSNFTSMKDSCAATSQNNYTKLTAGNVLGGCSTIGHFIYVKGCPCDFNSWSKIINDPTWSYKNVLPYFKKSENLKDPEVLKSKYAKFYGTDGPTGLTREPRKRIKPILEAFNETGNPLLLDVNGVNNIGYTQSMLLVAKGVRQSSAYNYLTPIKDRPNLYVLRQSLATRIIFEGKRAVAVAVVKNGETVVFRTSKEIILSAGVYNTPQLLMLSGIGPKEHLESFNITVKADLPVGENLQDQVATSIVYRTEKSILPPPPDSLALTKVPFPIIIGLKSLDKSPCADYQVFALPLPHATPFVLLTSAVVFQYRNEISDKFNKDNLIRNSLFSLITNTKPKSRGTIRLKTDNPFDKPLIKTGYYTNKKDLHDMVKFVLDFIKVGNSTYFQKIGAKMIDLELPECSKYKFGSYKFWCCYVKHTTVSVYHVTSTCAMGLVVDSKLRVYNVTNLRVVDASVMPHLTSGSPHASVLMIAEKASDMIKEDSDKEESCSKE